MIEVDLNPDHAHDPERTAHTADVLSDCVRILNYAVEKGGLVYASDGYRLVGELREASWRLVELIRRVEKWAETQAAMGAWKVDNMGEPVDLQDLMLRFVSALSEAQVGAHQCYNGMGGAHKAISRIQNTDA